MSKRITLFLSLFIASLILIACQSGDATEKSTIDNSSKVEVKDKEEEFADEVIVKDSKKKPENFYKANKDIKELELREEGDPKSKVITTVTDKDILYNHNGAAEYDGKVNWLRVEVDSSKEVGWVPENKLKKLNKKELAKALGKKDNTKSKKEEKKKKNDKKNSKGKDKKEKNKDIKGKKISGSYMPTQDLNVRKGPGMTYDIYSYASKGSELEALESHKNGNTTWFKVKKGDGKVGWVGSGFLTEFKKAERVNESPSNKNTNSITSTNQGDKPTKKNTTTNNDKKSTATNNKKEDSGNKYKPNHIYFSGKSVPY